MEAEASASEYKVSFRQMLNHLFFVTTNTQHLRVFRGGNFKNKLISWGDTQARIAYRTNIIPAVSNIAYLADIPLLPQRVEKATQHLSFAKIHRTTFAGVLVIVTHSQPSTLVKFAPVATMSSKSSAFYFSGAQQRSSSFAA